MGTKLYVGNLPYSVTDNDLHRAFSQHGTVASARVMMDRESGRSKGFGFVEMGDEAQAQAAIAGLNGQPLGGRNAVVNEARPLEPRPPRSTAIGRGFGGGSVGNEGGNTGGFRSPYGNGPRGGNRGGGYGGGGGSRVN
jgi:RNA recognition motif-containing protein